MSKLVAEYEIAALGIEVVGENNRAAESVAIRIIGIARQNLNFNPVASG
jgi:hypothetical protein